MSDVAFQVGGLYENRKGRYTVISVCGDRMRIRWDSGAEVDTDVAGQQRVLRNMTRERQEAERRRRLQERQERFSRRQLMIAEILGEYRVSGDRDGAGKRIADVLDEEQSDTRCGFEPDGILSVQQASLLRGLPVEIRLQPAIFTRLPQTEQIEAAWEHLHALPTSLWNSLSSDVRTSLVFRAAQEGRGCSVLPALPGEHASVETAMLLLCTAERETDQKFSKAHRCLEDWVLNQAWQSAEPLDLSCLLPCCEGGLGPEVYCEGRLWRRQNRQGHLEESVYCPRTKTVCLAARIRADLSRNWRQWSLLELLAATDTTPVLPGLRDPERYVSQMCGWINRLNEIRERLRCSRCGEMMIPNRGYAGFLARFNVTVLSCRYGGGHDVDVYLNQCWGCSEIIDSRESRHREAGYYVCIHCGSGPEESNTYCQGDMCPKCGIRERLEALGESRKRRCHRCGHVIALPHPDRLTGQGHSRVCQYAEWPEPS